jgi:hypothetical protein
MEARDDSADAAAISLLAMRPLITEKTITDPDTLRNLALINNNLQFIHNTLKMMGAKTKVDANFWGLPRGISNGN